ncbi:MAG: quinolinate synthase [Syntrophus sp. (in: bacteria)]|nr:quinolinate synthase [Syntrophus sp. (in: bacteria)]
MNIEQRLLKSDEILKRIKTVKDTLGKDLIILGHFYQEDDIVECADFVGDSLQLAQIASKQRDARYIVFCAVSFMAEMARILCLPEQQVFHPAREALCPLAEMAAINEVERAWSILQKTEQKIIPIVYVNSRADLKAFCGKNNGLVCTSANAKKVMEYVFSQNAIPFFFPDENLGRNTAHSMGIKDEEMFLWDPQGQVSGEDLECIRARKVILWRGFCYVHTAFTVADVKAIREAYGKDINIVVHPECIPEVVELSDYVGSTSFIKNTVEKAPSGSQWAIGTELHFVNRIKRDNPDKYIVPLKDCVCREMAKMTGLKLLHILENLAEGRPSEGVTVDPEISKYARIALERMLEVS